MKQPLMGSALLNLILVLNRFTLGMMFFLAGLHKIFQAGLGDFYKSFETIKPEGVPMAYGYLLPFVEIVTGLAWWSGSSGAPRPH